MSTDWGSVPDWIAGAGAATALVWARAAAKSARKASDLQGEELKELRAETREELASKVAVYIAIEREGDTATPVVRFVNAGDLPVYGLTACCFTPDLIVQRSYSVNGPIEGRRTMRILTARLTELFVDTDPRVAISEGRLVAACSFRDARGRWWYREANGELHEAKKGGGTAALDAARASGPISGPTEVVQQSS